MKHCDPAHTIYLEKLQELLRTSQWEELRRELLSADSALTGGQLAPAAVLALQAGLPEQAASWAQRAGERQLQAAAHLRMGHTEAALPLLQGADDHRAEVMRARAALLAGDPVQAQERAAQAHARAFEAGDAPSLLAAIALLGELELRGALESGSRTGLHAALNVLAEGLKIAEIVNEPADPHVLALIALTQHHINSGPKAQATAAKALDRSLAFSPAQVLALTVLGRHEEAQGQAAAGTLADAWWTWAQP
ncbi:hypothetical protein [Deinococcus piscis]|uniref:hypothetical protein n=1 Tax=Deinococcus piscis TaxID=394230 RepID=UPI00167709A1|nr:hypothetical protein [Deinococcus piscis]